MLHGLRRAHGKHQRQKPSKAGAVGADCKQYTRKNGTQHQYQPFSGLLCQNTGGHLKHAHGKPVSGPHKSNLRIGQSEMLGGVGQQNIKQIADTVVNHMKAAAGSQNSLSVTILRVLCVHFDFSKSCRKYRPPETVQPLIRKVLVGSEVDGVGPAIFEAQVVEHDMGGAKKFENGEILVQRPHPTMPPAIENRTAPARACDSFVGSSGFGNERRIRITTRQGAGSRRLKPPC